MQQIGSAQRARAPPSVASCAAARNSRRRSLAPRPLLVVVMSEVEETLKRINSHKGVKGIVICDEAGTPIRTPTAGGGGTSAGDTCAGG